MSAGATRTFPGRGHRYDLAIVGAGIAGSEAAMAAARSGLDVLLVTTSLDTVYMLAHSRYPLRPAPDTLMSRLVERSADSEAERWSLHRQAKYALEAQGGIHLLQSNVTGLIVEQEWVQGVRTWEGVERQARATALCVGSFLRARLVQGQLQEASGRLGEMAYDELYEDLQSHGVAMNPLELELGEHGEGLPYEVSCRCIAGSELEGFSVRRFFGLYAAGVCAGGAESYEETARRGLELAQVLVRDLSN